MIRIVKMENKCNMRSAMFFRGKNRSSSSVPRMSITDPERISCNSNRDCEDRVKVVFHGMLNGQEGKSFAFNLIYYVFAIFQPL